MAGAAAGPVQAPNFAAIRRQYRDVQTRLIANRPPLDYELLHLCLLEEIAKAVRLRTQRVIERRGLLEHDADAEGQGRQQGWRQPSGQGWQEPPQEDQGWPQDPDWLQDRGGQQEHGWQHWPRDQGWHGWWDWQQGQQWSQGSQREREGHSDGNGWPSSWPQQVADHSNGYGWARDWPQQQRAQQQQGQQWNQRDGQSDGWNRWP